MVNFAIERLKEEARDLREQAESMQRRGEELVKQSQAHLDGAKNTVAQLTIIEDAIKKLEGN